MMSERDDPKKEGHTREWQDRARVVLDAKKAAHTEASPNQSPGEENIDAEEKREKTEKSKPEKDDRVY